MTNPVAGESGDGASRDTRLRRVIKSVWGERAKNIYLRLYSVALFAFGALLTFFPDVFAFFQRYTAHPELIPVTLLVPYMILIFEMVLSRLERDEDSTEQNRRFEARLSEIPERRLERKTVVDAFNRSVDGLRNYDKNAGIDALSGWIAESGPTIEVLILAYSSETLLDAALRAAERIRKKIDTGDAPPEMIVFKLLTRDLQAKWRIPCLSIREADEDYRRGLNHRFGQHLSRWKTEFFRAFDFLPRDKVVLDVRWYPFEPTYKAIIVNKKVGLVGVYDVQNVENKGASGWDYEGHGARLYEMRADGSTSRIGQLALKSFTRLFDELWTQYSKPSEPF